MGNNAEYLLCDKCKKQIDLRKPVNLCPYCGGLLEVKYDIGGLKKSSGLFREYRRDSIWRYRDFFPEVEDKKIVTLGEGGTPLIKSRYLGPALGVENLYFKNDTMMPTGSFKDRGYSLAVSYAMDIGVKCGITYSSGNAGASFAAYSTRAGFPGLVMVEYLASSIKKSMIMLYGANCAELFFNDFEEIARFLDDAVRELGLYIFVNFINPIRHEAMKTYSYEIYSELQTVPDWSFHAVGTGGGLYGTWKGFNELAQIGVSDKLPHMVAVQPETVAWIKEAIDTGAEEGGLFGEVGCTIAQSINGNSPLQGGKRLLKTVRDSGGLAAAVSDEEILEAMRDLGREGIGAEPSSAATVAAFKQAVKEGKIKSTDVCTCIITGSALKQPLVIEKAVPKSKYTLHLDMNEFRDLLKALELM